MNVLSKICALMSLPVTRSVIVTPNTGHSPAEVFDILLVEKQVPHIIDDISIESPQNISFNVSEVSFKTGKFKEEYSYVKVEGVILENDGIQWVKTGKSIPLEMLLWRDGAPVFYGYTHFKMDPFCTFFTNWSGQLGTSENGL